MRSKQPHAIVIVSGAATGIQRVTTWIDTIFERVINIFLLPIVDQFHSSKPLQCSFDKNNIRIKTPVS